MSDTFGRAIVTYPSQVGVDWKFEEVKHIEPQDDELCVRIIASGICHSDIMISHHSSRPMVLGHEGSGYVTKVGSKVSVAKVGDPVSLSFAHCDSCKKCKTGHPAYCASFDALNLTGVPDRFEQKDGVKLAGSFFGQSSFSNFTVAHESCVVNLAGIVKDEDELKLFAPLGCGFQTGSGTVINLARGGPEDTVAVTGLGGVGLSAIMAAKLLGCQTIIGVDILPSKLELAKAVGATHVINNSDPSLDLVAKIRSYTDGDGTSITIDTSGNMKAIHNGWEATDRLGQMILVGVPPLDANIELHAYTVLGVGRSLRGGYEGDVTPSKYIPQMIQWYRDGKFPIEKLVKYYPAEEFEAALADMHSGVTTKPILIW